VKIGLDYCSIQESVDFFMLLSINCVKALDLIWFRPITMELFTHCDFN
jgi:hypothetical protein